MERRFTVVSYRPHAKASPSWLLHDNEHPDAGQIATFMDRTEAEAVALVLSAHVDRYEDVLDHLDPNRGLF